MRRDKKRKKMKRDNQNELGKKSKRKTTWTNINAEKLQRGKISTWKNIDMENINIPKNEHGKTSTYHNKTPTW